MTTLSVFLFGKFSASSDNGLIYSLHGAKVRELFIYLLLHYNRPLLREKLATLLWADMSSAQSKSYLRKTIWQMQLELSQLNLPRDSFGFLSIEAEWIQLTTGGELWLDVAQFEQIFEQVEDISGNDLSAAAAQDLAKAVNLYRGTLLEGWYQDWCIFERERLERMYLLMLDKLIFYCAVHGKYEAGISYGMQALRLDMMRERTYRRLMQLHCFAGNLPEALHQYTLCKAILQKELGVLPSKRTTDLYNQIVSGEPSFNGAPAIMTPIAPAYIPPPSLMLQGTLSHLEKIRQLLAETQQLVQRNINQLEATLKGAVDSS